MRHLFLAFLLCFATAAIAGESCDPNAANTCGPGLVCTSAGICDGPACGNGNVVCDPSMVCTASADCIPPCMVGGAPVYEDAPSCAAVGLVETADGRCVVPCWYFLCGVLGGACG